MASVVLSQLHKKYPNAKISFFTSNDGFTLLQNHPLIDRIYTDEAVFQEAQQVFDLVINLQVFDNAPEVRTLMQYVRARVFLGRCFSRSGRYAYVPEGLYMKTWVKKFFSIAGLSCRGRDVTDESFCGFSGCLPDILSESRGQYQEVVGIGIADTAKEWVFIRNFSIDYLRRLCQTLSAPGRCIYLFGTLGQEDEERVRNISSELPSVVNLVNKTSLSELFGYLRQCDCLVTVNSFFMHAAFCCNIPVVVLSGGVNWREFFLSPREKSYSIIEGEKVCVPCEFYPLKECNQTKTAHCIEEISPRKVLDEIEVFLHNLKKSKNSP